MSVSGFQAPNPLQSVFDNVGAALVVIDKEGRVVLTNPAFATLFGKNHEQSSMPLDDWAQTFLSRGYRFQDDQGRDIAVDGSKMLRVLLGEQVEPCDFRVIFPDGNWKWIHASAHLFSIVGLNGVLVIATDETVHVELRNIAARLERLETLGTVSRALAHDFNNILEVISANAYLALPDPHIPESTRGRLRAISQASQKAIELVRRLMQFGRAHTREMRELQINDLITGVLQLVRPLFRPGVHLKTNLHPGLPMVNADPVEIDQLLVNLIVNALDAMPQGGDLIISTEVEDAYEPGQKGYQGETKFVLISISDTGIGIPSSVQSQIFEPFFTTKQKGTGLGLPSVYGIVRQHSGKIKVHSEPAKGTSSIVSLPAR
jgi:two-component system, cell cycle sensor histidine kinase and response regulator CckA